LQTLELTGVLSAPLHERFNRPELNSLAGSGIATQETDPNNIPMILRVTTLATLARLLRNQKQAITSGFPRHKLADDGTRFGPGQAIATPGLIKAALVAQYRIDMFNGLVE